MKNLFQPSFSFSVSVSKILPLFLFSLGLLTALPSCQKDKYWDQEEQKPSGEQLLHISVASPSSGLRGNEEDPITKLQNLSFIFFDGDTPESRIVHIKELAASEASGAHRYTVRLKQDDYHLLVMANKTEFFSQKAQVGTTLKAFNEATSIKAKSSFMNLDNLLVTMFNAQGLVAITKAQFEPSESEGTSSPIKVELEPVTSRFIILGYPTLSPHIKNLLPEKYYFSIVNCEQTQQPLRTLAPKSDGTKEALADGTRPEERYAFSPSYKPFEECKNVEEYKTVYQKYRFPYSNIPTDDKWLTQSTTLVEKRNNARSYRFETTCSPKAFVTAVVPHIFVLYKLCPTSLSPTDNEGWISYKGHYMLESDFKTLLQEAAKPQGTPKAPAGFPADFIDAVKSVSKNTELAKMQKGFEAHGIRFYYKSQNYYAWPIRHFNNTSAPNADSYGRYGVVRNNEYRINVKRLNTFGLPHSSIITEDFSPLKEEASSQVEITVAPIVIREDQEVEY